MNNDLASRRSLLRTGLCFGGLGVAGLMLNKGAMATLVATPRQSEGPFYPRVIPNDSDADLVQVAGSTEWASGTVTHVFGRVLSEDGRPMTGVRVEIWQCDAFGHYHYDRDMPQGADPHFQGYGQMTTGQEAAYRFRTIRPVPYSWRTPHIHFAVSGQGFRRLTTQMYLAGEPLNETDAILNRVRDPAQRAALIVALKPSGTEESSLSAQFDLILGRNLFS